MTRCATVSLVLFLLSPSALGQDRTRLEQEIESLVQTLVRKEKEFLAPAPEDQAEFAEFLRQPNTGLIRLLPREKYSRILTTPVHSGGSFYSFVRLTQRYGYGSDIRLAGEMLAVGNVGQDLGFFVSLGDLPLEAVTLDHNSVLCLICPAPDTSRRN